MQYSIIIVQRHQFLFFEIQMDFHDSKHLNYNGFFSPWINGAKEEPLNLENPLSHHLEQITMRRIDCI